MGGLAAATTSIMSEPASEMPAHLSMAMLNVEEGVPSMVGGSPVAAATRFAHATKPSRCSTGNPCTHSHVASKLRV